MRYLSLTLLLFLCSILAFAVPVAIPNASFESKLVGRGYDTDGVVNGQMDDSDILAITFLDLNNDLISGTIDLTAFSNLTRIEIQNSSFSGLIITGLTSLENLYIGSSNLTSINVSTNINLKKFGTGFSSLTSLDVSSNTLLEHLFVNHNPIGILDVTNNPSLIILNAKNTNLSSINLSNNPNLTSFDVSNTTIASLDLRNQNTLSSMGAINCPNLSKLYINASTGNISYGVQFNNCPLLTCVQVDNVAIATNKVNTNYWIKDPGASLSLSCSYPVSALVLTPATISLPQQSNSQISSIPSPQPGMMTWSTDDNCVKVYNGTAWNCL